MTKVKWTLIPAAFLFSVHAYGSELIYTPINPSFGGYSGNGTYLLNNAQAQDQNKDPNATDPFNTNSIDNFTETLNRLILSQLARRIVDNAFGSSTGIGNGGTFTTGDYIIDIDNSNPSLTIVTITDTVTGEVTQLEIPTYY